MANLLIDGMPTAFRIISVAATTQVANTGFCWLSGLIGSPAFRRCR
jgi:hypothetical protein